MIRRATQEDIHTIYELIYENYAQVLSKVHSQQVMEKALETMTEESLRQQQSVIQMYVLEDEGEIVATGFYSCGKHGKLPRMYLTGLFTKVAYHGRGLGGQLLGFICDRARQDGASRLHVPASPNAIRFYEKMGFVIDDKQPDRADEITWMTAQL